MYDPKLREEEIKIRVGQDFFADFDTANILGNIDFCVTAKESKTAGELFETQSFLWAEAKKGTADSYTSVAQLVLTVGKARTFEKMLPPPFLAAFDSEKIAFVPYEDVQEIFYQNDFNWSVTPSNYETKEFKQVRELVKESIGKKSLLFYFGRDKKELTGFIKENFVAGKVGFSKVRIDKNNFIIIYNKWLAAVKPSIAVNWEIVKKSGIIDGDFYLADLLSHENESLKDNLFVILKKDSYQLDRKLNESGLFSSQSTSFTDKQKAHSEFWNKYERPPKEEYWDYIIKRRDLLVPQDVRERKGSFFTPQIWVELSQKYLADVLGKDWQDEYYIWDCAAGTGNLLNGLTNKDNIWASTLDRQDVDVMHDRIENGANLWKNQVFQFDFLNDSFDKLPAELKGIIDDPEKRKKLVIYMNPPYAEATSSRTIAKTGENKTGVSTKNLINKLYKPLIGNASNEIFALFMAKIYKEIPDAVLAQFSKMKFIQGSNFRKFNAFFQAEYKKGFVVPADTFDNVKGKFPIGFTLWKLSGKAGIRKIKSDVFDKHGNRIGKKIFYSDLPKSINNWLTNFYSQEEKEIATLSTRGNDFQNQKYIYLAGKIENKVHDTKVKLYFGNIQAICVYFAVRHCASATWLNDRDQFLHPNKKWEKDTEFQNDCLAFTLFHGQNRISAEEGTNHWIPFTEAEVGAKAKFENKFMSQFIAGKLKPTSNGDVFGNGKSAGTEALEFSDEAQSVFAAGRELWKYYHAQPNINVNASFYDIRAHFQGRNAKGRMNSKSSDEKYTLLLNDLRDRLKDLAQKIEPKVYEYGFLLK